MRELHRRYTEFGNSIISRYCGFDTYYDPMTLLFPQEQAETKEADKPPQYTNIYQLWNLKEENHIYEKKLTFLTNLLEKNIYNYTAFSTSQYVKGIIHDQLPEVHNNMVKQMTNEVVNLFRNEKHSSVNKQKEVITRLLEEKYEMERAAAEKLYLNIKEKTNPIIIGRNSVIDANHIGQNVLQKQKNVYQNNYKISEQWNHLEHSDYELQSQINKTQINQYQTNQNRTEVFETNLTENTSFKGNESQIRNTNHIINVQNQKLEKAQLRWVEFQQREQLNQNITESKNFTQNINQVQWLPFYSRFINQYQNVNESLNHNLNRYESSSYMDSSTFSMYFSQMNTLTENHNTMESYSETNSYNTTRSFTTQTEALDGKVTENIKQIQWMRKNNPIEFYSHWMNLYQSVNNNENSWYSNASTSYVGSPIYPAYLSQYNDRTEHNNVTNSYNTTKYHNNTEYNNVTKNYNTTASYIDQMEEKPSIESMNGRVTENRNRIQWMKQNNPIEFYSNWMKQYQNVNKYENNWYSDETLSYVGSPAFSTHLSQMNHMANTYIDQMEGKPSIEITDARKTENRNYTENINQIQWMKQNNPIEFYSNWMKQSQTVNKYTTHLFRVNQATTHLNAATDYNVNNTSITVPGSINLREPGITQMVEQTFAVTQAGSPNTQSGQVSRSGGVSLVYGADESGAEQEKNRKKQTEVIEIHKQVLEEMEYIKETREEVEQLTQTYQQWERTHKKAEAETLKLNSEQGKRYVQQEAEKVFENQLNESITQITGKVYRRLEQRLKTERDRRGIM